MVVEADDFLNQSSQTLIEVCEVDLGDEFLEVEDCLALVEVTVFAT